MKAEILSLSFFKYIINGDIIKLSTDCITEQTFADLEKSSKASKKKVSVKKLKPKYTGDRMLNSLLK